MLKVLRSVLLRCASIEEELEPYRTWVTETYTDWHRTDSCLVLRTLTNVRLASDRFQPSLHTLSCQSLVRIFIRCSQTHCLLSSRVRGCCHFAVGTILTKYSTSSVTVAKIRRVECPDSESSISPVRSSVRLSPSDPVSEPA